MGMRPDDFWNLTWSEFISIWDVYNKRHIDGINDQIAVAWRIALWTRYSTELPPLKECLISTEPKEQHEPTVDEQVSIFKILTAQMGGSVVEV